MQANLRVLFAALVLVLTLSEEFDPDYTYADFNRTYPRSYTGDEWTKHEAAFKKNYAELVRLKKEGKNVAINDRLDWTDEQIRAFCNYIPQNSDTPFSNRPLGADGLFASPTMFDWRLYGYVTQVKNQGSCGAYWAFSVTAQYESKLAIATNGTLYDLAEQYLLKCQTAYSQGCDGGFPQRALQLLSRTGAPLEQDYPYNPSIAAGNICTNTTGRVKSNLTVNAVKIYQNLTVEQLQQDLVNYGPINVGVYGSDANFMNAGSGTIRCGNSTMIDHAVLLVGYNSTHWFVKNSWGFQWGDNGYGYISKNTANDCNIRQYVSEMQVSFSPQGDQGMVNVSITMTDSGSDGWNGNVISIKQYNNIVGTFGANFTNGSSSGPIQMLIQGNFTAQTVVSKLGNKSDEVQFMITAPNGTVLSKRVSGDRFNANQKFQEFCILGACPATTWVSVTMTDTGSNGWESNVIAFRQNNTFIGTFGDNFTKGATSGPLFFTLISNIPTQIFLKKLGKNTQEIGFVVKSSNGSIIYQRIAGKKIVADTVFTGFCPSGGCPNTFLLNITMTDAFGDGWSSNIIALKQKGVLIGTFGNGFIKGNTTTPVNFTVYGKEQVQIVVFRLGAWTQEIGFIIRAFNGTIIYQKKNGTFFYENTIFSVFCPNGGCAPSLYTPLIINMFDSGSDGWNSNVLAIRQNNKTLGIFGKNFTAGSSTEPVTIFVQSNVATQIAVAQLGSKTNEVKFIVQSPNNTILHQRNAGKTFEQSRIFATFCPDSGCTNILTLLVTMTNAGNGWNGNVLALRQGDNIVGVFGEQFALSGLNTPKQINVIGNILTQVVVAQLGTRTNQIGFMIWAANESLIYTKNINDGTFNTSTIFKTFCPLGDCLDLTSYNLTVTMTASPVPWSSSWSGYGWRGTVLAIKQNEQIIATFGETFTTGSYTSPINITVHGFSQAQIVVYRLSSHTEEIGFVIKYPNETIIYQRVYGQSFDQYKIFSTFCLSEICQGISNYVTLEISLTDSYGDGWNNNYLAIKQNNRIMGIFGNTFTRGTSSAYSIYILVQPNLATQIIVLYLGSKTYEIGFVVKAPNGTIIHQRYPGTTFDSAKIFGIFCMWDSCSNMLTLTVAMSDSIGDGWNSNILAIKQNNSIVGTFGDLFTSGRTSGPITINVLGDLSAQIVVLQLGTKTEEIGFVLTAPNGTIIHQRNSGSTFTANTTFSTFCPIGACPDPNSIILSITMTDTNGDGWSGNILAIKQNNRVVGTFGDGFTNGFSSGPVYITVQGNLETQIIVYQLGQYSYQIGFTVKTINGTIIHHRTNGSFTATTIFKVFCLVGICNSTYYLTTSDAFGDGWEGTVLAFKQNGIILSTFTLINGSINSSIFYSLPKYSTISVTVYTLGNYTNEIGFTIKNYQGNILFQRIAGSKFVANTLLGTFCQQCLSSNTAAISSEVSNLNGSSIQTSDKKIPETTETPIRQLRKFYMKLSYFLAALILIFILILLIAVYKFHKVSKSTLHPQKSASSQVQKQIVKKSENRIVSVLEKSTVKSDEILCQ